MRCGAPGRRRSVVGGEMSTRGLFVFQHDCGLGKVQAHQLFERIEVNKEVDVPLSFYDYDVAVDEAAKPTSVTLITEVPGVQL